MIYFQPQMDVMGKRPVWLEDIFPLVSIFFDMGEMNSITRNLKFFWRRYDVHLVVIFF